MKKVFFIISLMQFICFSSLYAWGVKGHKMVAVIAKQCLEKSIIDSVQYYLGNMSFEEASVWMDEMRNQDKYDYMKPWHYINIEKDKTYVKTKEPNAVNQIELAMETLKNNKGNKDKMNNALKILFHLVGDLHMPLHCGYGSDKGGNDVDVEVLNKSTNLHHAWDSDLIEVSKISVIDCLKLANSLTKSDKDAISKIDVVAWMQQSRDLLPQIYNFNKGLITQEYIDKNKPVIEKQLLSAGIRLAAVLHQSFQK